MNGQLELWHVVLLALSILGGYWTLTKIIAAQFQRGLDERFAVQERTRADNHLQTSRRLDSMESIHREEALQHREEAVQWQRVERDMLQMRADMPLHYVRREDYIRGQSVIEAKLDGLGTKLENAQLRALNNNAS